MKNIKIVTFFFLISLMFTYCSDKRSNVIIDKSNNENCSISDEKYFQTYIWNPIIKGKGCFGCHKENGVAETVNRGAAPKVDWGLTENISTNYVTIKNIMLDIDKDNDGNDDVDGLSMMLLKPTLNKGSDNIYDLLTEHGGGVILSTTSDSYKALQEFYTRLKDNKSVCTSSTKNNEVPQGVVLAGYIETLQKAGLSLIGRVPTKSEENQVYEKGFQGLQNVLDQFMNEKSFYNRLRELLNDIFLTDKYAFRNLLNTDVYPKARWYDKLNLPNQTLWALRNITRLSITRSPIELMIYLVRNNKPFNEVVTANYVMLNPFSARSYDVQPALSIRDSDIKSVNNYYKDYKYFEEKFYDNFKPTIMKTSTGATIPHAGILTDNVFLMRYPTTATNVNRHRAHNTLKLFLNFDILKEILLPNVDLANLPDVNPTFTNAACTGCHTIMDPISGLYKNWDRNAQYKPIDWFDKISLNSNSYARKMRVPGMTEGHSIPANYYNNSLQWMGKQIAQDKRFSKSIASHLLRSLTGANYINPGQPGYEFQNSLLEKYASSFRNSTFDLKKLIKDIISGPYFRAKNVLNLVAINEDEIFDIGIGRMLTPEQLSRKINSVLGQNWSENPWDPEYIPYLLNRYKLLYGGIDSDSNTVRFSTPNAVMANIQMRMATSMSCQVVAKDFGILDKNKRAFFTVAEKEYIPFTATQAASIPSTSLNADCALEVDANDVNFPGWSSATYACSAADYNTYHSINGDTKYKAIERTDAVLQIKRNIQFLHKKILGEILPIFDAELNNTYKLWRATYTEYAQLGDKTLDSQCMNYNRGDFNIYSDDNFTIKAWQAVITYLLSDYRFVFE